MTSRVLKNEEARALVVCTFQLKTHLLFCRPFQGHHRRRCSCSQWRRHRDACLYPILVSIRVLVAVAAVCPCPFPFQPLPLPLPLSSVV